MRYDRKSTKNQPPTDSTVKGRRKWPTVRVGVARCVSYSSLHHRWRMRVVLIKQPKTNSHRERSFTLEMPLRTLSGGAVFPRNFSPSREMAGAHRCVLDSRCSWVRMAYLLHVASDVGIEVARLPWLDVARCICQWINSVMVGESMVCFGPNSWSVRVVISHHHSPGAEQFNISIPT